PYAVGPPGIGAGADIRATWQAEQKSPESGTVAPVAAAAKREQERRRRRRPGQIDPGYRYEYLEQAAGNGAERASVTSSDRGAGNMGLAGGASQAGAKTAAGLTTLTGDSLGGGPRMPMLPSTWPADAGSPNVSAMDEK
ncbi:MAG: PPE family protein, partial [Mycobacterium sp.]